MLRPFIASSVLGAAVGSLLAASVLFARAEGTPNTVFIDNFVFAPKDLTVKAGTTVTWTNRDDIPHGVASSNNAFKKSAALDTRGPTSTSAIYTRTWWARSSSKQQRAATLRNDATIG
jgi:plastocyanin